jgi:hypothetical protein
MQLISLILGIYLIVMGLTGISLSLWYWNPLRIFPKRVDFEEVFGTNVAKGLFIFLGLCFFVLWFILKYGF